MKAFLTTERLTLKPLSQDDADLVVELFTDPVVKKHTGGPQSEASIREEMRVSTRRGGNGCIGIWTIVRAEDGEKLGTVALLPMPVDTQVTDYDSIVPGEYPDAEIEIGFFLKPSAWRQGYAVEACRRVGAKSPRTTAPFFGKPKSCSRFHLRRQTNRAR